MKWMVHGKRLPGYYPRILCIALTLLLAGLSYYYHRVDLPRKLREQETSIRQEMDLSVMKHDTALVLREGMRLEKGVAIDEEALNRLIEVERPVAFLPDEYLKSKEQVVGRIVERAICGGEVLVPKSIKSLDNRQDGYYRLVSVAVRGDLLGSLAKGKDIDLLAHWDDGTYEILVSKAPLMQVAYRDGGGAEILIPVDDYEQRLIERVRDSVTFSARLYLDPTQPTSPCIETPPMEEEDAN